MTDIDLTQRFPSLTPIKSPPKLFQINGCGTGMYGRRDQDAATGTYVSTCCLSLLFIPLLCLRAYRVAKAPEGGWYFIGREPLSAVAKGWNGIILAAVIGTIGLIQFGIYTSSPAYKAKQQMAAAERLVQKGNLTEAARVYQSLATTSADQAANATAALRGLLDEQCKQAPLKESAGVYAAAALVARRQQNPPPAEVADQGMKLVAARGETDPAGGVAVLDAVRPLVLDTRPVDAQRLVLLRKSAVTEPSNLDVITPLASLLEEQGKLDEAKKLLLPVKDKLGDGEGARVLGTILGRAGDYDAAYALLWPYVKSRLDQLHSSEKNWESTLERLQQREINLLDQGSGPADFYKRYDAAGEDAKTAIVQDYLNTRIKNDPEYTSALESLQNEARVVPVALELGIVMLQRAQGQTDPAARKSQLESCEQIFLAVRGVAGESDEYRLSLGEVYYWLGKQDDGRKLFDEYLAAKSRAPGDLLRIGYTLRNLGAEPDARAISEEAYAKASKNQERHDAAILRALCSTDNDDQIAWLQKGNTSSPTIKGSLAKALGNKALQDGQDEEAVKQFRAAIDAYAGMPRTAATLNETALACYAIFQTNGDAESLKRCYDYFQQAVELEPRDSILLYNAGVTLLDASLSDVVGDEIDLRALRETASISTLGHLYRDQAGRDAVMQRVKDHPGVARATAYLDKVTVLAPKGRSAFAHLASLHQFTRNEPALRKLEQRIRENQIDTADELQSTKDYINGVKDAQRIATLNTSIKRSEEIAGKMRPKGGATAALALDNVVQGLLVLDTYTNSADLNKAVALAEEARKLSPSADTAPLVWATHLCRAVKDLRSSDAAFDAFCKTYERSLGTTYIAAVVVSEPGPFQQKMLQHPGVQKALKIVAAESKVFTEGASALEWALLKNAHPTEAKRLAEQLRTIPRKQVEQSIGLMLSPYSAGEALESYWLLQILGKSDEARQPVRKVAEMGIPVPLQS